MSELDRRTIVKALGMSIPLGGLVSPSVFAQDDENGTESDDNGDDTDNGDEPDYGEWFDDVDNYEETEDELDEDEVTVEVGAGDDGFEFDPPAIRISEGTTVVWEWTGEGGQHDVVHDPEAEDDEDIEDASDADEPEFESELTDEDGHTFEHEFDEAGTYLYVCTPHQTVGMRGAVVVEEE